MDYKYFKTFTVLRVLGIFLFIWLFFLLMNKTENYILVGFIGIVIFYQTYSLIRFVEKTNRELARFLDAIRYEDFSCSFKQNGKKSSFNVLSQAFSGIINEIKKYRNKTEEHYQYLQTVVQHIGIGIISFQQNGKIGFINSTALKLLGLHKLTNIHELKETEPTFTDMLLQLENGEHVLVPLQRAGKKFMLSIHTTKFLLQGTQITLISLQNIKKQLEQERAAKELEVAHQIQTELLPKKHPQIPSIDITGFCKPAREIGGDYYDYIHFDSDKIGIVIGDVSGKGLPAAIYMTLTKGIVQSKAEEVLSPKSVLIKVNSLLYQSLWRDSFVTMFYGVLDLRTKRFTYARAGHNPPVHLNSKKESYSFLESRGIALGLADEQEFTKSIEEKSCELQSNDMVVFYTDGFTEVMNRDSIVFGETRLIDLIINNRHQTSKKLIENVYNEVSLFSGDFLEHDDMTMVSVKIA